METNRNKDYSSSLMECIYEIANDQGIDLIELDYCFKNSAARDFYKVQRICL
ncbi:hypothetical protein OJ967_23180 [Peribacillus frigoritolerans]|nr:hypothetical protein [Peribacillus frigoritolerans]UYY98268.1 hypothetical protein OJ967_23180 [Peribacillus frigoritolerans]